MIYLRAIFLFRFLPFGDFFTAPRENSVVKGLGDILLKFGFSSCFGKHFAKYFKGYQQLITGAWYQLRAVCIDDFNRDIL